MPRLSEQRLIDASGRERWCARLGLPGARPQDGQPLLLCVLQDSTAEHVARAQADRSLNELAQWFDLSPTGMLVFDEAGLIVRSNPAFEALVGPGAGDADRRLGRPAGAAGLGRRGAAAGAAARRRAAGDPCRRCRCPTGGASA